MAHGLPAIEAHSTLLCMQMAKKLEQLGWLPDLVSRLRKPSVLFAASCTCNVSCQGCLPWRTHTGSMSTQRDLNHEQCTSQCCSVHHSASHTCFSLSR